MRSSWIKLGFAILLLVGLPVFIWAVATQRIELRKKAAETTVVCWDRVASESGTLTDVWNFFWPNSCKGNISTDSGCAALHVPLTPEELTEYHTWVASGSTAIPGCAVSPLPTLTPTEPATPSAATTPASSVKCTTLCSKVSSTANQWCLHECQLLESGQKTCAQTCSTFPAAAQPACTQYCPIIFPQSGITPTNTPTPTATPTPLATPTPVPALLRFHVKLAGVTDGKATDAGTTMTVKFFLKDGTVIPLGNPLWQLPLTYEGNGVYKAERAIVLPNYSSAVQFAIQAAVDKHLALRFCKPTGQTEPCDYSTWMTIGNLDFNFTGRPMPAGDLDNNGRVDADDLKIFTDLWHKTPSQLTVDEVKKGDVNYNGSLDQMDFNEILKTLSVRYNE